VLVNAPFAKDRISSIGNCEMIIFADGAKTFSKEIAMAR